MTKEETKEFMIEMVKAYKDMMSITNDSPLPFKSYYPPVEQKFDLENIESTLILVRLLATHFEGKEVSVVRKSLTMLMTYLGYYN